MKHSRSIFIAAACVLLGIAALFALWRAGQNPTRAFDDMLANNLSTTGVTRIVRQKGSGLSIDQYTQLNLSTKPTAHALTTFKQNGGTIVTEEISDQKSDYVQYRKIIATHKTAAGKPVNTSGVVGKWAKLDGTDSISSSITTGLFDQSVLGVLPIANLEPGTRVDLLKFARNNNTFSYDAKKVSTTTLNGRSVYKYDVSVQPVAYVALMQRFGKLVGANEYAALDPHAYAGAGSLALQIFVDRYSHELAQIYQPASKHTETYQGFGIAVPTSLPHTTLSTAQLEQRITMLSK